MSGFIEDMVRIKGLVEKSLSQASVCSNGSGTMNPQKLQRTMEETLESFEQATMELRLLAERNSPGVGEYGKHPIIPARDVTGYVSILEYSWLHIALKTLLPHCRFQAPGWLSDTIRRLLDDYEASGGTIPRFRDGAVLFIDERSNVEGRHIYDQDNKGWKAVSNALKGRVFPDDDQYSLGVALLSSRSEENRTHITVVSADEAGEFLSLRGCAYIKDIYAGL
ncbi:MAG: hypothetical protein J6Z15_06175 [Oscillospiraceae bacterium]|nr:hypothetical protein [Oscillospiraceae bacterium]